MLSFEGSVLVRRALRHIRIQYGRMPRVNNKIIHHLTGGAFGRIACPVGKCIGLRLFMVIDEDLGTVGIHQWQLHILGPVQDIKIKAENIVRGLYECGRLFFILFKLLVFL